MSRSRNNLELDAHTQTLFNDVGVEGMAAGFFYVEHGLYKAMLLASAEVTVGRKYLRTERRRVSGTYIGVDAKDLASVLRTAGWVPPKNLAELCESSPWAHFLYSCIMR